VAAQKRQRNNANGNDAFLTKLDPPARWFTRRCLAAKVGHRLRRGRGRAGRRFVVGTTVQRFPTNDTAGFEFKTFGKSDVFVTALNADASAVLYSAISRQGVERLQHCCGRGG